MGKSNRPAFLDINTIVGSFFCFISDLTNMQYQLHLVAIPSESKTEFFLFSSMHNSVVVNSSFSEHHQPHNPIHTLAKIFYITIPAMLYTI